MKNNRFLNKTFACITAVVIGSTAYGVAPIHIIAQESSLSLMDTDYTKSTLLKGDAISIQLRLVGNNESTTITGVEVSGQAVDAENINYRVLSQDEDKESAIGLGEIVTVSINGLKYTGQGDTISVSVKTDGGSISKEIKLDTITDDEVKGALMLDSSVASNMSVEMEAGETKNISLTIKNSSSQTIDDSVVKVNFKDTVVGLAVIDGQYTEISRMASGSTKEINFTIDASETVAAGTYPVQVEINDVVQTVYLEVVSDAVPPAITLSYDTNQTFAEGEVTPLILTLQNVGDHVAQDVKINMRNNNTIGIVGSSSLVHVGEIQAKSTQTVQLDILPHEAEELSTLEFDVTYKTKQGELIEETQYIYIHTGVEADTPEGQVFIKNTTQPTGTYSEGNSFEIGFSLISDGPVEDAKITLSTEGGVVPTSQNVFILDELNEGEQKDYTIELMVVESEREGYQPVEIKVEYTYDDEPITVTQYSGVNVAVLEDEEEDEEIVGYPKVIVNNSNLSTPTVEAGGQVTLEVDLLNTHSEQTIKNLTVQYVLSEDLGENGTNQVFSPVQTGDTLYTGQILPGQTARQSITLDVANDATNQDYPIEMRIEYEDEDGREISMTQSVTIPVVQEALIEIGQISHTQLNQNQPNELTIPLYNRGQSDIENVMISLEGEGLEVEDNQLYISSFAKGSTQYYLPIATPMQQDTTVTLVAQYEDTNGQLTEVRYLLELPVAQSKNGVDMTSTPNMPDMQEMAKNRETGRTTMPIEEENYTAVFWGIGGTVVAGLLIVLKLLKGRKTKEETVTDENL